MSQPFTWSYSKWAVFAECQAKYNYKFNKKLPDPPGGAMERGNAYHAMAERAVCAPKTRVPVELASVKARIAMLRKGTPAEAELQLAVTRKWTKAADYWDKGVWLRSKIDALKHLVDKASHRVLTVDWKTGKMRDGYDDQLDLYNVVVLSAMPEVEEASALMAFIDQEGKEYGDPSKHTLARVNLPEAQERWTERARKMETAKRFVTNPTNSCSYCPYRRARGGPCKF